MNRVAAAAGAALAVLAVTACSSRPQVSDFDACKAAYAARLAYYVKTGHQPRDSSQQPKPCQVLSAAQRKQAAADVVFGGQS